MKKETKTKEFPVIDMKATGINLKRIMKAQGFKAKDIQHYLGLCGVQSVYHWLNGSNLPSVDNLYALSVLFRLPIDELLCGNKKNILGEEDHSSQCRSLQNYFEEVRENHVA